MPEGILIGQGGQHVNSPAWSQDRVERRAALYTSAASIKP